jgi:hypothetical protein
MFDMSYRFLNHFWLSVGANVIGTPDDGSGYWVPYRTNDTFYTQAGVLF